MKNNRNNIVNRDPGWSFSEINRAGTMLQAEVKEMERKTSVFL